MAVDLAIVAYPSLRAPALTSETARWDRLVARAPIGHRMFTDINAAMRRFLVLRRELETWTDAVRSLAVVLVVFSTGILVYATVYSDDPPENAAQVWLGFAIALAPAALIYVLDRSAKEHLRVSSNVRRRLEDEILTP